jgi:hypothetical protein
VVVGGYAVAFHGFPRLAKDINVFFGNSMENDEKISDFLVQFGFPKNDLEVETFITAGNIEKKNVK